MATIRWTPQTTAVAQESRATPANVEIGDVFALKIGGVTIATFTAAAATVANVTAGLAAAWATSTHPYATAITASDQTTYLKLLANEAGVPFTVTSTTTDGGGANTQTLTITTPTASAGPNDWSTATNWSSGTVPVNSDVVIIENSNVPIIWGLDQSSVTLAELRIMQSYTGYIGLPEEKFATSIDTNWLLTYNTNKPEYRDCYLKVGATLLNIGQNNGISNPGGSSRLKINLGSAQTTATVYDTATASLDGVKHPVRLLGTHASNAITVLKGRVGIATSTGSEVSTVATLNVRFVSDPETDSHVTLGSGVTWGTINKTGGILLANSVNSGGSGILNIAGAATINVASGTVSVVECRGGSITLNGGHAVTSASAYGGTIYSNTSGTITTIILDNGGVVDMSGSSASRTVTNVSVMPGGGTLIADMSRVSLANGILFDTSATTLTMKAVLTPQ